MRNRLGPALDYHSMAGKRSVEQQLAALDELRHQAPEACIEPLRKVLAYRNNYVVAKAADLVREFRLSGLMPELLAAFDRFFANPIRPTRNAGPRTPLAARSPPLSARTRGFSCV